MCGFRYRFRRFPLRLVFGTFSLVFVTVSGLVFVPPFFGFPLPLTLTLAHSPTHLFLSRSHATYCDILRCISVGLLSRWGLVCQVASEPLDTSHAAGFSEARQIRGCVEGRARGLAWRVPMSVAGVCDECAMCGQLYTGPTVSGCAASLTCSDPSRAQGERGRRSAGTMGASSQRVPAGMS